jgi:hypothetical protein
MGRAACRGLELSALHLINHGEATHSFRMRRMSRDSRQKRDLHALNDDGMVLCNPRDKEAAHRAEMEEIATEDRAAVTCRQCLALLYQRDKARHERQKQG